MRIHNDGEPCPCCVAGTIDSDDFKVVPAAKAAKTGKKK